MRPPIERVLIEGPSPPAAFRLVEQTVCISSVHRHAHMELFLRNNLKPKYDLLCEILSGTKQILTEWSGAGSEQVGSERYNLFTGCPKARTATFVLRGGSEQFLDEADRSLHDAIMIVRRAMKNSSVVAGGGAIDMELCNFLRSHCSCAAVRDTPVASWVHIHTPTIAVRSWLSSSQSHLMFSHSAYFKVHSQWCIFRHIGLCHSAVILLHTNAESGGV